MSDENNKPKDTPDYIHHWSTEFAGGSKWVAVPLDGQGRPMYHLSAWRGDNETIYSRFRKSDESLPPSNGDPLE